MSTDIASDIWESFRQSKRYREEFVADHVKRSIPFQARALMEARGWSQQELSRRSGISQGQVSRAIDPSYGNLTLNTIIRLAAGFDVAFIGRFVPFSELARWYSELPNENFAIPDFEADSLQFQLESAQPSAASETGATIQTALQPEPQPRLPSGAVPSEARSSYEQTRRPAA